MLMAKSDTIVRRVVEVAGRRISYLTVAVPNTDGGIMLFIHGAGVSALTWMHQLRGLAGIGTPIAVDLPGRRESDAVAEPTLELYADTAFRVLERLGDRPALVVGHSLGGAVAQVLATRHPERVSGLILISTCARVPPGNDSQQLLGLVPIPFRRIVFLATVRKLLLAPSASMEAIGVTLDEVGGCPTQTMKHDVAIGRAMDTSEVARGLRVPTLVLCGGGDRLTPSALSRQLSELIPEARLQVVPAAGHMLPLEAPSVVNHVITDFAASIIREAPPRASRRFLPRLRAWRPWRRHAPGHT